MLLELGLAMSLQSTPSRFVSTAPFGQLPYVKIDQRWAGGSFADDACRRKNLQARAMWIDGTANLHSFSSEKKIVTLLEMLKSVGFNTVVLDVKPIVGRTIYPSSLTEQLVSWKGISMPKGFDPVKVFRSETTRLGLSFLVSMNAFSEGHSYAWRDKDLPGTQFGSPGWGYDHPELQTVVYSSKQEGEKFQLSSKNQSQVPLMMNPHQPAVQERVLAFVREIVTKYQPDGLLFDDRFRYHGLDADFSQFTRGEFQKHLKQSVKWPDDVFAWTYPTAATVGIRPGRFFDDWLTWRADTLAQFTARVRKEIQRANPPTQFGIYAGSWYGDYAKYGSNYASTALQAGFPFLTRSYQKTGYANNLDILMTGCYYKVGTMYEAMGLDKPIGQTVEAAGDVSNRVARDQCWTYAGIQMVNFTNDLPGFASSLQAAAATTQGVMIFDYSHSFEKFLPTIRRAFSRPAIAPHTINGLLQLVRAKRQSWDKKGFKERAFPILEGAPGTGF